jgi:hypothetical protein
VHGLSFVGNLLRCTLHAMRKFNWSFNLTCIGAVVCGALQDYGNIQSTVIWKRVCLSTPDLTPEHTLMYCPGPTFLYKVWEELDLFAKGGWWSSGVVVLPGKHFVVVRFEHANVKTFQLHNMGKEAERYVGVVSLSPPLYRNLATRCLGYILGIPHVQVVQFDHKAVGEICSNLLHSKVWNNQIFSHLFIIVGLSLHFQYSGHIVKVVSYQYRSPFLCSAQAFLVTMTV